MASAIQKDFARNKTIYFKLKKWADRAKEEATKEGIRTRLSKTSMSPYRYKLTKIS